MDKKTAIQLLGGTPAKAAAAMGYNSIQAVYMWPDAISDRMATLIRHAASKIKPSRKKRPIAGSAKARV
jgi:hypothetical protein